MSGAARYSVVYVKQTDARPPYKSRSSTAPRFRASTAAMSCCFRRGSAARGDATASSPRVSHERIDGAIFLLECVQEQDMI